MKTGLIVALMAAVMFVMVGCACLKGEKPAAKPAPKPAAAKTAPAPAPAPALK